VVAKLTAATQIILVIVQCKVIVYVVQIANATDVCKEATKDM